MKFSFTLSIGYHGAKHEDIMDYPECDDMSEEEREEFLNQEWQEWSNDYIDGGWWPVEEA